MRRLLTLVLAGLLAGGCSILGLDKQRVLSELASLDSVVVPDSALVGEAFTVTAVTVGDLCHSRSQAELRIRGNVATITLYHYRDPVSDVCIARHIYVTHEVTVRFAAAGEAYVVLRARRPGYQSDMQLRKTVQVYSDRGPN